LGSQAFREAYGLKYAYLAGSMYKGIASEDLVVRLGRAGLMGSFGTGGLKPERIEAAILSIRSRLNRGQAFGMNLLSDHARPDREMVVVDLFLRHGIDVIEASGYMQLTPAVVKYRLAGLVPDGRGAPQALNRVIAKLSRPEVARLFLAPAPENMVDALVKDGAITREQARLSRLVPMADDICVEADSAGHTDRRPVSALFPAVRRLRDEMARAGSFSQPVRVGLAGGIGTPAAAAAAFVMGADFIMTGSINQATVEAGISDAVKDMLVQADVQDTDYAPAGDLFEIGSQIQVLKRGLLFPSRANKLHELYRMYDSLGSIDARTRENIEKNYFRRRFEDVYEETRQYLLTVNPKDIQRADKDEKTKMALVFKWYFVHTMRLALTGSEEQRADYQVHCGPALGSFNRWVQGTSLEQWQNRHVDGIGERLMVGTADVLQDSFWQWCGV
jgi:trans-AT polyketide synthase/acyltransferase/oxidoreductase domain-containing protein